MNDRRADMLFDSHAHLNNVDITREEFAELIKQIEDSQLDHVVDIGFDADSSEVALEHAARYPWCYAAVGFHPHEAKKMNEDELLRIRMLADEKKAVAIGEIGLDFHYDMSPRDVQRQWFRRQIQLANKLKMPICIHSRDADQEVMDILKEEGAFSDERKSWFPKRPDTTGFCGRNTTTDDARVLLHCFSGSAELARQYVKLGATISIAGPVTFKNNRKTIEVVEKIPLDFLLVETDSPYLSPEPFRGKRNTPVNVEYTCRKVAEIKGISFEEAAVATEANACRFYGIS